MLPTFRGVPGVPSWCSLGICFPFQPLCWWCPVPKIPSTVSVTVPVSGLRLSHAAARATNVKGANLGPSFHLGLKVSQVFWSPFVKIPPSPSPAFFSLKEFRQDSQGVTLVPVGTGISDRRDSFLCLSYPFFSPSPPSTHFNISEWTPIICILMSPHRGQRRPSERQHLCSRKAWLAWWVKMSRSYLDLNAGSTTHYGLQQVT